jgi:uncharacterized protein
VKIEDRFHVSRPVDETWRVLLDVERIAPCMPGAELQEVEGDEYRGLVKVKVGPITAQYKGVARIADVDDQEHRAVIEAQGRDTRGQGNASAAITATLEPDGDGTVVRLVTDLTVTGKVAQFGRGVMADVSSKLLAQFVECLEREVLAAPSAPAPTSPPSPAAGVEQATEVAGPGTAEEVPAGPRRVESREAEAIDLLRTAGASVLKRLVPAVVVLVIVAVVVVLLLR